MRHPPYSSLAKAVHEKREAGRREEVLDHLHRLMREAVTCVKPLYLETHAAQDPAQVAFGKILAHLIDAGDLVVAIREQTRHTP